MLSSSAETQDFRSSHGKDARELTEPPSPGGVKMYYLLIYKTGEDYIERRAPHRAAHLAYANGAHAQGELVLGGALADPVDSAILVFRTDDRKRVEDFARNDPYVRAGLIKEWTVRPWTVVIGR
jgi:uncharacterized protein YciI